MMIEYLEKNKYEFDITLPWETDNAKLPIKSLQNNLRNNLNQDGRRPLAVGVFLAAKKYELDQQAILDHTTKVYKSVARIVEGKRYRDRGGKDIFVLSKILEAEYQSLTLREQGFLEKHIVTQRIAQDCLLFDFIGAFVQVQISDKSKLESEDIIDDVRNILTDENYLFEQPGFKRLTKDGGWDIDNSIRALFRVTRKECEDKKKTETTHSKGTTFRRFIHSNKTAFQDAW